MRLKKIIIAILLCIALTGCGVKEPTKVNAPNNVNETEKFINEYSKLNSYIEVNIPSDTKIHYASSEEVLDILTNGTGIVYFGRPTCPWCRNVIPVLASVALDNNLVINYYNPGEVKADEVDIYLNIKNAIKDYLTKDENGDPEMYLPDVFFVKDGKVVGHKLGSVDSQYNAYFPLTDDQRQELIDIYTNYIEELK